MADIRIPERQHLARRILGPADLDPINTTIAVLTALGEDRPLFAGLLRAGAGSKTHGALCRLALGRLYSHLRVPWVFAAGDSTADLPSAEEMLKSLLKSADRDSVYRNLPTLIAALSPELQRRLVSVLLDCWPVSIVVEKEEVRVYSTDGEFLASIPNTGQSLYHLFTLLSAAKFAEVKELVMRASV